MDSLDIYRNEDNSNKSYQSSGGDVITDYYTIVLHQSLYFTKCFVVSNLNGELITYHEENNNLIVKRDGLKELIPEELTNTAYKCIKYAVENFKSLDYDVSKIVCMSICTHRNIIVVWNKQTGKSLYNALAEDDSRCDEACQKLIQKSWRKSSTNFQHLCGLPISAKWGGVKLKWLIDNISSIQNANKNGDLRFGTLDSWLLWQLTGGECYATDVTNASYTMLMNLHRCNWDSTICKFVDINMTILPEIKSCTEMFGKISIGSPSGMDGLSISGSVCDIKASLIGQQATQAGSINVHIDGDNDGISYVTIIIGEEVLFYRSMINGIGYVLSTAAYQFGNKANVMYALEATVHNSHNLMPWIRDCWQVATSIDDIDCLANSVTDSNGCYFIPTRTGRSPQTPLEQQLQRSSDNRHHVNLWGINLKNCRPGHIVRSALEAVVIEIANLLSSIAGAVGRPYDIVNVCGRSGGLQSSDAFCQLLADHTGIKVERLAMSEAVILGGTLVAVLGANLDPSGLQGPVKEAFSCLMVPGQRSKRCRQWLSLANEQELLDHRYWIGSDDTDEVNGGNNFNNSVKLLQARNKKYLSNSNPRNWGWRLLSVIMIGTPFALLGFGTALILVTSRYRFISNIS